METALEVFRKTRAAFRDADVVHIHSNTFMNQVASAIANRRGLPFLLTHYGTEIWHYRPRRVDPFLWMNRNAAHVTYYSRLLLERSLELGVDPPHRSVVYPPVDERFRPPSPEEKRSAREALGLGSGPLGGGDVHRRLACRSVVGPCRPRPGHASNAQPCRPADPAWSGCPGHGRAGALTSRTASSP